MRIFLFFMTLKEIYKKEKGMTILNITTVPVGIL